MVGLLLQAVDVADDQRRWRWLLTDERTGAPLADHEVSIDPAEPEIEAFADLYRYLRWHADPDRRVESEASIVDRVGTWIGEKVLGKAVGNAIVKAAPATVRVQAPGFLLSAPLELAHVNGSPLARRGDVTLVFDVGADAPSAPAMGDHLRMVAVFSLPTETTGLALRRERYELARLVRRLAARSQRTVSLEVLQYGVTREVLRERMTDSGGPDVLHLSGHGATGMVVLETDDGRPDPVPMDELLDLLRPAKGRLRLAVLSACQSAAVAAAETLRWLKLDEAADEVQQMADAETADSTLKAGLAQQVARQLECAVVAMRYPVIDDFAIRLSGSLYEGLFTLGLPVDRAVGRAVPDAAGPVPSPGSPAISIATPIVLGTAAIGMTLTPPKGPLVVDPAEQRMAEFPDEPVRFVGRAGAMARASRALAAAGVQSGVLFHGMAGAGKTACALELAYRHRDRFAQSVWWQAPTRQDEWPQALTQLALALEAQLGDYGFAMVDKIATAEAMRRFLPKLRTLLRDNGLLLVLDNLETLLTDAGGWRDPRWAWLLEVLANHGGESRVVLTSRIRPADLPSSVQIEPVHALSRDESVLLARELPHLRRLLHTDPGPTRLDTDTDRATVRRVLHVVQGHPKLLELADAAAADPAVLADQLTAAEAATADQALSAFFTRGESTLDDVDYLGTLATWTRTTMATLPPASQLLLQILAGLEDADRQSDVLEANWAGLCQRLDVHPPNLADTLAPLVAGALVERDGAWLRLHPGIAETIRADTPAPVREAIDAKLGTFWHNVTWQALQREGGEHTATVVRAGLAAAPYLLRRQQWDTAGNLIEQALNRDHTVTVAQLSAAHLRRIADATGKPAHLATLGKATMRIDPAAGERLLHTALQQATTAGEYRLASGIAANLADLCRDSGRLREALALTDRAAEHSRRAGLGPWTQLAEKVRRLQILYLQGQTEHVLAELHRLVDLMPQLPDPPADNESVQAWAVRDVVFNLGALAARFLGRWQEALGFNAAGVAGIRARGADRHAIALAQFNSYGPLLRLGHLDQAEQLLLDCQQTFEDHHDIPSLAKTFTARADLADERGRHRDAVGLGCIGLRLLYTRPDPEAIGGSHHNLAGYMTRAGIGPAGRRAHRLAAATIAVLTGQADRFAGWLRAAARDMRELSDVAPPSTIAEVAAIVEQVEGVRFSELVIALAGDLDTAQQALNGVLGALGGGFTADPQ